MRFSSTLALLVLTTVSSFAQIAKELDDLNRKIDQAVVDKNIDFMKKHYADDFVFTHSTGLIDSKQSWIKNIENMGAEKFLSRTHDSTKVEMHGDVAIIFGKLSVERQGKEKISRYALHYVRVFAIRNKVWQMICHKSTDEVRVP
ncbi:MAG TPA: nuclear transport factor 2 family protein [Chryseosolibacter sp.]